MDPQSARAALRHYIERLLEYGFVCFEPQAPRAAEEAAPPAPPEADESDPAPVPPAGAPDLAAPPPPAPPQEPAPHPAPSAPAPPPQPAPQKPPVRNMQEEEYPLNAEDFPRGLFSPAHNQPLRVARALWDEETALPASPAPFPPPLAPYTPPAPAAPSEPDLFGAPPRAALPPAFALAPPAAPPPHEPGPPEPPEPPALSWEDRVAALSAIAEEVAQCRRCPLCEQRTRVVPGQGDPLARLVFVGEGPGADEDAQGLAFVGRAGQLLGQIIHAMGLRRDQVFICNVVKCRPPGNRNPEPEEMAACEPFLKRQLETLRPAVIVALGAVALKALLRDPKLSITKIRGNWRRYEGIPLMPTFHPAYLLRNPADKRKVWDDMRQVMKVFGLKGVQRHETR